VHQKREGAINIGVWPGKGSEAWGDITFDERMNRVALPWNGQEADSCRCCLGPRQGSTTQGSTAGRGLLPGGIGRAAQPSLSRPGLKGGVEPIDEGLEPTMLYGRGVPGIIPGIARPAERRSRPEACNETGR
jgi:hypothetical protein